MKWLKLVAISSLLMVLGACATTPTEPAQVKRISPEELAKLMPPPVATVTLDEIVTDSKQGKSADEIIAKIKSSNSSYDLTPSQTVNLSKQGVDTKVLDYIHQSYEAAKQNAMADELNRREQEKIATEKKLERARDNANYPYYGPFWSPFGYGYYPYYYPYGFSLYYRGGYGRHRH